MTFSFTCKHFPLLGFFRRFSCRGKKGTKQQKKNIGRLHHTHFQAQSQTSKQTCVKIHSWCGDGLDSPFFSAHTCILTGRGLGSTWRHSSLAMLWRSSFLDVYSKYCKRSQTQHPFHSWPEWWQVRSTVLSNLMKNKNHKPRWVLYRDLDKKQTKRHIRHFTSN